MREGANDVFTFDPRQLIFIKSMTDISYNPISHRLYRLQTSR